MVDSGGGNGPVMGVVVQWWIVVGGNGPVVDSGLVVGVVVQWWG